MGICLGFGLNSVLVLLCSFVLDIDIIVYEFIRIAKHKKRFSIHNFLDEKSYQHRFIFHLPLLVLPLSFIFGALYVNWIFGLLLMTALLLHLVHDSVDKNFDGIMWLWPFNSMVYKFRGGKLTVKTKKQLEDASKNLRRGLHEILRENK